MKTIKFWRYAGFGVAGILGIFAFTFVVMWLWNSLVPELFRGPELSYWQTMGLLVLSKILFSGISGRRHDRSKYGHEYPPMPKSRWRQKYEAKMNGKVDRKEDDTEITRPE
jgi:hypothetical protein